MDNNWQAALRGEPYDIEHRIVVGRTVRWVRERAELEFDKDGALLGGFGTTQDITERKLAEREREITVEFLRLINKSMTTRELIHAAATFFQEQSGCSAIGIRLKEGNDYPYYEAHGFPPEFLEAENHLCVRSPAGDVIRDCAGYPVMECMCGNIISGHFDPSKPFFTARGSFWTNSTTELLATSTESDRQGRTRNRCNAEGYESMTLIALHVGEERFGLLQLNDRRKEVFSPQTIALWERLADQLSVALAKVRAEEALHELNETLEQRVAERTAMVEEQSERLRALATELGQVEQRERGRLAGILHDHIQQLLVAARMQIGVLARQRNPKAGQEAIRQVESTLREATEVSRSLTVELSPPILQEAGLAAALGWLARRMEEKNHFTVVVRFDSRAEPDSADLRAFLFNAVRELLFNALKHSGVGIARVTMTRTEDGWTKVVVEDEGQGFDPQTISNKGAQAGGFGLFSIQQRLSYLGGRMDTVSVPGEGTRITLRAPLRPIAEEPTAAVSAKAGTASWAASGTGARRKGHRAIRIVLADDHKILRQGMISFLEFESDIEVVGEAKDGQEAVELARRLQPDAVVMDVTMPRMSGIEATRIIASELPNVKVVGLSMHTEGDMSVAMREAGASAFVAKGGPSETLIAAIRACVSKPADQSAPARPLAAPSPSDGPVAASTALPPKTAKRNQRETRRRKIRVLVADDHENLRTLLVSLLEHEEDIEVVAQAGNGEEAVQLAHSTKPAVIVMDVSMPIMNGVEATQRIAEELPDIRVVGLSAYGDEELTGAMRAAGAVTCMVKQSALEELVPAIRACANKRAGNT